MLQTPSWPKISVSFFLACIFLKILIDVEKKTFLKTRKKQR